MLSAAPYLEQGGETDAPARLREEEQFLRVAEQDQRDRAHGGCAANQQRGAVATPNEQQGHHHGAAEHEKDIPGKHIGDEVVDGDIVARLDETAIHDQQWIS